MHTRDALELESSGPSPEAVRVDIERNLRQDLEHLDIVLARTCDADGVTAQQAIRHTINSIVLEFEPIKRAHVLFSSLPAEPFTWIGVP